MATRYNNTNLSLLSRRSDTLLQILQILLVPKMTLEAKVQNTGQWEKGILVRKVQSTYLPSLNSWYGAQQHWLPGFSGLFSWLTAYLTLLGLLTAKNRGENMPKIPAILQNWTAMWLCSLGEENPTDVTTWMTHHVRRHIR